MTESSAEASGAEGQAPAAEAEECATCITARGFLIALGFAAFAAFVAADFATGGRLSAVAVGALATLRGRVPPSSATGGTE
jgi:hypothetical protein